MARKSIPIATRREILHEAGFRCANPTCRTILTLEIHHLDQVAKGGADTPENLLALCPNCHTLHHKGIIPRDSLQAWKHLLMSLNEAFDARQVDTLLCLGELGAVSLSGDGLLSYGGLIVSGYLRCKRQHSDSFTVSLSDKGRVFVEAWKRGDAVSALSWQRSDEDPPNHDSGVI